MEMDKTDNRKYVAYFRVSTQKQGKSGLGLEAQKDIITHYFNNDEIVKTFTDVQSGKDKTRKNLLNAIEYCKNNNATLVVAKVDRLSRKTEHALNIYNELNGNIYSCDLPQDKGTKVDKFILTMMLALADKEAELISIRTKQALRRKLERDGKYNKGQSSEHMDNIRLKSIEAKKSIASNNIHSVKAKHYIVLLRSNNVTYSDIAIELTNRGYLTPQGSNKWNSIQVSRIFNNPNIK